MGLDVNIEILTVPATAMPLLRTFIQACRTMRAAPTHGAPAYLLPLERLNVYVRAFQPLAIAYRGFTRLVPKTCSERLC
jgi:hypothetical protein